jgi:hypothetical protein
LRRCPVDHRCMTRITVESVLTAARQLKMSAKNLGDRRIENV